MTPAPVDVCVAACAEAWRGGGETVARPVGLIPTLAAHLARRTFAPDLLIFDGEASLVAGLPGAERTDPMVREAWMPLRSVLESAWSGRGHVMMSPSQIDRFGSTNVSAIGRHEHPSRQLVGMCGYPGNSILNTTSFWLPRHRRRHFVERVDVVCGVGHDHAPASARARGFPDVRRVVTDLAVLDLAGPDHAMRLVSVHPGATPGQVRAATGFALAGDDDVAPTPRPDAEALAIIERADPDGRRHREGR